MRVLLANLAFIGATSASLTASALALATPAWAQSTPEVNNGTDPTLLATSAGIQYKYTDFGSGFSNGLFEASFGVPFGQGKNKSLSVTVPYASGPIDDSFGFGDVSLTFTHVLDVNSSRGYAYTAKLTFDTADRLDLGGGQTVLELSGFYAKFLKDGSIIAPALVQTIGLGDEDPGRSKINTTTFDFYYVPKLPTDKIFITFDPALIYDWERDEVYAGLSTTFGFPMGKAFGGDSQIFIKPQILAGANRPADWSLQVGYKVIGF
ncbi:hypothetical protein [Shimia aestuarii]|uniref:MetA-pathway of phenol degradation n=1 Tax=Shimia aestuarii TaxID=254406 RepID=A0A1I4IQI7_9RHOB|nr:hypothetical protein [Shimia aestuarii]SFL56628.1 hypothetical protein SAMN04488042_101703 [Shimia aestuarii]